MADRNVLEFRNLTKDELNEKLSALKAGLYNLRYQAKTGRIEKPHKIKEIKKDIARITTVLNERVLKDGVHAREA